MTNDELRALADALSRQRQADEHGIYCAVPRQAVDAAIKHLRAQADAQPVGFVWYHRGLPNFDDSDALRLLDDRTGNTIPLYAHPAPAAPQAEPNNQQAWIDSPASAVVSGRDDAQQGPGAVPGTPSISQAEPKREPLSDERIDAALQTDPAMVLALMSGEMTVGEFKVALRRLARTVERAHGIGGSDAE